MHGIALGYLDDQFGFVDYEEYINPQMRIVNRECFATP
jgi:hypothetical protein